MNLVCFVSVFTWLWYTVEALLDKRHCHHKPRHLHWTLQLLGLETPRRGTQVEEARREVILSWICHYKRVVSYYDLKAYSPQQSTVCVAPCSMQS